MTRGYQWFVAWRYLMARPRRVSRSIAGTAILAALVLVGSLIVAYGVLDEPQSIRGLQVEHPLRNQFIWIAVAAGALLELVVLFGIIRYTFSFFTSVSVGGVTIGSMALVITLSIMSGFETDLRNKILGTNAHILIEARDDAFTNYRDVQAAVADIDQIIASTPYLSSEVVIGAGSNYSNVVIKGVDPDTVAEVTDLERNLQEDGSLPRLWPLAEDGSVLGRPVDQAEPTASPDPDRAPSVGVDSAPDDLLVPDDAPVDFSAGVDAPSPEPETERAASRDEALDDLLVPDDAPVDFSAGVDELPPEPAEAAVAADDAPAEPVRSALGRLAEEIRLPVGPPGGLEAIPAIPSVDDLVLVPEGPDPFLALGVDEREGAGYAGVRRMINTSPRVNTLDGVLAGRELVKNLHLYLDQEVTLVSPLGQITPAGPAPRTKPYRVAGTFYTGMYEYDTKFIYVELTSLQRFLSMGDEVNGIEIRVVDPENTEAVKAAIIERLGPGYDVKDWKEINRSLFAALKLEKIAMFLVLAIIILVASFSIIGNLIMVVVEKAREIALLKTLGSSNGGIMKIFVVQGFFIGLVGTGVGVANGLLACWLGETYGLPLDPNVYYIDRLPIHVEWAAVAAVGLAGVLISVVATLYPAYLGAHVRPVEGLRQE